MATEKHTEGNETPIHAASMALLETLKIIGTMSAIVTKLQEEVEGTRTAPGLADALDLCLGKMHSIVAPAQEAAFQAESEEAPAAVLPFTERAAS